MLAWCGCCLFSAPQVHHEAYRGSGIKCCIIIAGRPPPFERPSSTPTSTKPDLHTEHQKHIYSTPRCRIKIKLYATTVLNKPNQTSQLLYPNSDIGKLRSLPAHPQCFADRPSSHRIAAAIATTTPPQPQIRTE